MELHYALKYRQPEVVSAERLRFRDRPRLWLLGAAGLVGAVFVAGPLFAPALSGTPGRPFTWLEPVAALAVLVLLPALIYFLAPIVDFHRNRVWRTEWNLRLNNKGLRMNRAGGKKSFEMDWAQVSRVQENELVYLLFYGGTDKFIVIPKRLFEKESQLAFFQAQIKQEAEAA